MTNKKEITAGIIIIGNEVLSGRTKDINTSTLAKVVKFTWHRGKRSKSNSRFRNNNNRNS